MAKLIDFYIPTQHRARRLWTPEDQRGKTLAFPTPKREMSVWLANAALWPLQSWMPATSLAGTPKNNPTSNAARKAE
jgi:hypothetical protein